LKEEVFGKVLRVDLGQQKSLFFFGGKSVAGNGNRANKRKKQRKESEFPTGR